MDSIKTYINEVFSWNNTVYDLLSLSYFYQGFYELSLKYVDLALSMEPDNERLLKNKKIIEEKNKN